MAVGVKRWSTAIPYAAALALAACAAVPTGRGIEQEVRVETPGCDAARCELRNDRGHWIVERTPGAVTVLTSNQPLEVACRVPDVTAGTARLLSGQREVSGASKAAGSAAGAAVAAAAAAPGFALGGPFGLAAGMVVVIGATAGGAVGHEADASRRPFGYPTPVQVMLDCRVPDASSDRLAAATWGLAVRGARSGDAAPNGAVWVLAVSEAGRASIAGLRPGDLLLAFDGRPLSGTLDLQEALRSLRAPVELTVRRGGEMVTFTLSPPSPP
jgi:hypothetical protein